MYPPPPWEALRTQVITIIIEFPFDCVSIEKRGTITPLFMMSLSSLVPMKTRYGGLTFLGRE